MFSTPKFDTYVTQQGASLTRILCAAGLELTTSAGLKVNMILRLLRQAETGRAAFREQTCWSIQDRRIVGKEFEGGGNMDRSETRNS